MSLRTKLDGLRCILRFDNRWELIWHRTFAGRGAPLMYKYKGLEFVTDHAAGDATGARELLATDTYRTYLRQIDLPREISVLDLGANNGGFVLLLSAEGHVFRKAVCVELNPATYQRLATNVRRNFGQEVQALNAAVCGSTRTVEFRRGTASVSDSIYQNACSESPVAHVQGVTLDALIRQHFPTGLIDICKIDIERAEFEVFASSECEEIRRCRFVLMEIHHERDLPRDVVIESMKRHGFAEIGGSGKTNARHHLHLFQRMEM
jgi:FkbM family methyltransferase